VMRRFPVPERYLVVDPSDLDVLRNNASLL
jgi:hypothetical protein